MNIQCVTDPAFRQFGRVLSPMMSADTLLEELVQDAICPENAVHYEPSAPRLETHPLFRDLQDHIFGGMSAQLGCCCGNIHVLNCLEYHRGSEFNLAAEDMILLLADVRKLDRDFQLSSTRVQAFSVPAGTPILIYETTLHYAPISGSAGKFHCLVGLPRGTNTDLPEQITIKTPEDRLLWAKNKWLIAHADAPEARQGAFTGLNGNNITLSIGKGGEE